MTKHNNVLIKMDKQVARRREVTRPRNFLKDACCSYRMLKVFDAPSQNRELVKIGIRIYDFMEKNCTRIEFNMQVS